MKTTIGSRIRTLRRERRLTQEQLADLAGVSAQAVSKWENDITLPDIMMMPRLAVIFGTSTDDLFSFDKNNIEEKVMEVARESWVYRDEKGDPEGARRILFEGLERYPENPILLNNILATYDYKDDADEIIETAPRCIDATRGHDEYCDCRFDAYRILAYAYKSKGDARSARAAVEAIPEIYFSKLSVLADIAEDGEKRETAEREKYCQLSTVLEMMQIIAEYHAARGEKALAEKEAAKAEALIDLFRQDREWVGEYRKNFERISAAGET